MDPAATPEPRGESHLKFHMNLENGYYQIPKFQRDFVWEIQKTAKLIDSMVKGYPIGTFVFWKTKEKLGTVKDLGDTKIPQPTQGEFVEYVLDGQQRMVSLFYAIKGKSLKTESKRKSPKTVDYSQIFLNLEAKEDEPVVTVEKPNDGESITIFDLLNEQWTLIAQNYDKKYWETIQNYQTMLQNYRYSTIVVDDLPLEKAVEIFERINTEGKVLETFEILVAKTFDEESGFDLVEEYDSLNTDLEKVGFEIPKNSLLQLISITLKDDCKKKTMLTLEKDDILKIWQDIIKAVKTTIDYFKAVFHIPGYKLLPYRSFLVMFGYFFYKTNSKQPTKQQAIELKRYFWKSTLSERFGGQSETFMAEDKIRMNDIINGKTPTYSNEFRFVQTEENITWANFNTGNAIIKSILCLFAQYEPKRFNDNAKVTLDNKYLTQQNSKNYHHFFPKAYLTKKGWKKGDINIISNITLVDDFANKRVIRDKAPSDYIRQFQKDNPELETTMESHLIDMKDMGIWEDDYEEFLKKRGKKIFNELETNFNF